MYIVDSCNKTERVIQPGMPTTYNVQFGRGRISIAHQLMNFVQGCGVYFPVSDFTVAARGMVRHDK